MNKQVAEHELLWMGDDDWTGLWEAVWAMQSLWPELEGSPALEAARQTLKDLLLRDMVYISSFNSESNTECKLLREEALELLTTDDAWKVPDSEKNEFRFATTDKGSAEMHRLEAAGVQP